MGERQLHLNYFHHPSGCHEAGWRHPGAEARDVLGFEHLLRVVRMCEDACFDSVFLRQTSSARRANRTSASFPIAAILDALPSAIHVEVEAPSRTLQQQGVAPAERARRAAKGARELLDRATPSR